MQFTFTTPGPAALQVEIGSGAVEIHTDEVSETVVEVRGAAADETVVEQRGDHVVVVAPSTRSSSASGRSVHVSVTLPRLSTLTTRLGTADLTATGTLGTSRVRSGSGNVRLDMVHGDLTIDTGSGDVTLREVVGDLRAKSGSGDFSVERVGGTGSVTTGSGDVEVGVAAHGVTLSTGSGDLRVREASRDVGLATASGDLTVDLMGPGEVAAKNVSGDIRIGVPGGLPVWTDVSTLTGAVRSTLSGAGEPSEGQPHLALRAKTVSGDIYLEQR